jgi:hypothetical protein
MKIGGQLGAEVTAMHGPGEYLPDATEGITCDKAVPGVKRRVVVACASCILADDQVTVREVEVLRAICDRLDCPMPPLLVGEAEGPGAPGPDA